MESMNSRRLAVIAELTNYANQADSFLNDVLRELDWTRGNLQQSEAVNMEVCPIDSNHRMPNTALPKHIDSCIWKNQHPDIDKDKALPSSHFFYTKSTSVVPVLIDKDLQQRILKEAAAKNPLDNSIRTEALDVPPSVDRCITDLKREERLAIYDYVVLKGKATNKPRGVTLDDLQMDFEVKQDTGSEAKSHLEILAELRDYKRRRPSYRAKNVHITKKSYTEVLSEVIANQTQYILGERAITTIKEEPGESEDEQVRKDNSIKSEKRHHSRDSSSDVSSPERSRYSKEHKSSSRRNHKHSGLTEDEEKERMDEDRSSRRHHGRETPSSNSSPERSRHTKEHNSSAKRSHKHKRHREHRSRKKDRSYSKK